MDDKKRWALNTAKIFYKEVEKKFENVNTKEEAVEVFRKMFPSRREFYKHLKRHIIDDIYNKDLNNWIEAEKLDVDGYFKYSLKYLKLFLKTISEPSTVLYQRITKRKNSDPRVIIYSKLNTFAIVLEGNNINSILPNKWETLENWIKYRESKGDEIIEVGVNGQIREASQHLRKIYKRYFN